MYSKVQQCLREVEEIKERTPLKGTDSLKDVLKDDKKESSREKIKIMEKRVRDRSKSLEMSRNKYQDQLIDRERMKDVLKDDKKDESKELKIKVLQKVGEKGGEAPKEKEDLKEEVNAEVGENEEVLEEKSGRGKNMDQERQDLKETREEQGQPPECHQDIVKVRLKETQGEPEERSQVLNKGKKKEKAYLSVSHVGESERRDRDMDEDEMILVDESDRNNLRKVVMNNYFSIGIDSQVCLDFHNLRETHPGLFWHKYVNFGWYGMLATKSALNSWMSLKSCLILKVDGKKIHINKNIMAIVFLNIPSYAGGTDLWGKGKEPFSPQTICDHKFEVVGIRGVNHMGLMQSRLSNGKHIAQGSRVKIYLLAPMPVQIDGEPWMWPASKIHLTYHGSARMLFNSTRDKTGKKQQRLLNGSRNSDHSETSH
eukprot:TRINITY_DN4655_c0_g1_i2.p1 TRINITY_DN4655_c0_g1~~TRINITY_DN4655_c0_g1_i2.p1  ORF type:complete len:427 (+),score=104.69 TRINITY_DN4655_c0_g1_i2:372-1652(+)